MDELERLLTKPRVEENPKLNELFHIGLEEYCRLQDEEFLSQHNWEKAGQA
jgi:hypothetical protein